MLFSKAIEQVDLLHKAQCNALQEIGVHFLAFAGMCKPEFSTKCSPVVKGGPASTP